ncbi:Rieske (2Fe-2S) protein [Chitinasiproducens palmae]|uniref:Ferredoxin subunit of nitrite reductase or a ring-hydroxylating dioxygenase n=1 Tax=Chitinasiproducens palmae TaxID=1770053 RepID=A0A1H2PUT1_9BURK|nr:Rieske 2Fe-2S domain-containing protein [Chitinasiproducens palmae]SDV50972.1 Ferredoxin subunit of nitrite reductase or a ring-hydroxylating dioxygenase [Chitinasiproducens palmae]
MPEFDGGAPGGAEAEASGWRRVCDAGQLRERGCAVLLPVRCAGQTLDAFFVRVDGVARGYLNRCAHQSVPLDWNPGQFFDTDGLIVCAMHGARFRADDGVCIEGPCRGGRLQPLQVVERPDPEGGGVYWRPAEPVSAID